MKKIYFASLDSAVLQWLRQALEHGAPDTPGGRELRRGIESLGTGASDALMLEVGGAAGETEADGMTCGDLVISPRSRRVLRAGKEIALTPKEFDLLVFLASNKGIALSREKILQKVWNYDYFGEDRTVDTHVKMLRGHLGKCRSYIATVWGIGYKFDPDATR